MSKQCEVDVTMRRTLGAVLALIVAVFAMFAGLQSASAADRPVGVAFVKANPNVWLKANGAVLVTDKIRCVPGWQSGDLSVHVSQASGAYSDGFVQTNVACNGKWHTVHLTLPKGFGKLHRGAATISSQFLVTNLESGDSAGGHDATKGWIRPVCPRK
jgi:hypothetical protein